MQLLLNSIMLGKLFGIREHICKKNSKFCIRKHICKISGILNFIFRIDIVRSIDSEANLPDLLIYSRCSDINSNRISARRTSYLVHTVPVPALDQIKENFLPELISILFPLSNQVFYLFKNH